MNINTTIPFIRDLCKDLPEEEIQLAENRFRSYVDIVHQIAQRRSNSKDFDDQLASGVP